MIKKKEKSKLINEEDERERTLFQTRLCIWFPLIVYETNLHVSLLFIQGYTSTGNNRVILVHLFFFGFRKKKKKNKDKETEK